MSTSNNYVEFLADFRETIASATARLRAVPEERSRQKSSPDDWSQPRDKNEPATLEYLIRDYVVHLRHHLNQIFEELPQH